ncbi:MAG: hypothetical protein CMC08_05755, partial [Flavobacteriaceae bacterium]|nr:hypothetical protein [Flavobacteriaceae bacterium]
MRTFLNETLESLLQDHQDLSTLTLILPSKRAGGFLKNEIRQRAGKTQFAPRVISIEEYIEELSGLQIIEPIELLFRSFEAYQKTEGISEKEDFDTYASWGQTLLNDFNEIDRYLVDTQAFFTYLSSIKTLERWNLTGETTSMVQNFLSFWSHLPALYANLQSLLREHSLGYQGMVYREAANKVNDYANQNFDETFIFIGFNALNHAEQAIITTLLEAGRAEIYWDIDTHFLNDTQHGASLFLRQYLKGWKYYEKNSPKGIGSYYQDQKQLQIVAAQKNVAQAKYVGDILNGYSEEKLTKTAIVLADEHLLMPVLQSLPPNVKSVNVTMGAVLKQYPASVFFELLFNLHLQGGTSYYFKDVLALLNHNFGRSLLSNSGKMAATIQSQNKSHLSWEEIKALA